MAQGSVRLWAAAAAIVLGACAEPARTPPPAPAIPAAPAPQPPPPAAPAPAPPRKSADRCGAAPLQYLVGRPHTDIPVPLDPALRRVVCSSCVFTQDYVPARQTIVFDSQTGLVTSVRCG